jgi:hypothetical protein
MQRFHTGFKSRNPASIFCTYYSIKSFPAIIFHSIYVMISIISASNHVYIYIVRSNDLQCMKCLFKGTNNIHEYKFSFPTWYQSPLSLWHLLLEFKQRFLLLLLRLHSQNHICLISPSNWLQTIIFCGKHSSPCFTWLWTPWICEG